MDCRVKQAIAFEVIRFLKSRFDSFPSVDTSIRNAPFHKAFLEAFSEKMDNMGTNVNALLSMSSWIHGLNTTLGQSFFENVSQIICNGEKKTFINNKIYKAQMTKINEIMTDLKNSHVLPNKKKEDAKIANEAKGGLISAPNFTVDCYYSDDSSVVAIELKSVRPNSGEMRGEKQKILISKAVLRKLFPNKKISYYFGFPFDPLSETDTGSNKKTFMNSVIEMTNFCDPKEVLLADEFWSFLSAEKNTMQEILDIINAIASVNFCDEFEFITNPDNLIHETQKYIQIATKWNLHDEVCIAKNIKSIALNNSKLTQRAVNASVFDDSGKVNQRRLQLLMSCVDFY